MYINGNSRRRRRRRRDYVFFTFLLHFLLCMYIETRLCIKYNEKHKLRKVQWWILYTYIFDLDLLSFWLQDKKVRYFRRFISFMYIHEWIPREYEIFRSLLYLENISIVAYSKIRTIEYHWIQIYRNMEQNSIFQRGRGNKINEFNLIEVNQIIFKLLFFLSVDGFTNRHTLVKSDWYVIGIQ